MNHAQRLRQTIEDEIVDGVLPPGTRLDEVQLAERFGVSRTPIREALLQLAMTGLIEMKPRRGAVVSTPDPTQLLEMFETMAELEAACARLAARRLTPQHQAELVAALEACRAAAETGDASAYYAENTVFHAVIYRASRNGFLCEQATQLSRRLAPFRRVQLRVRNRLAQSFAEHEAAVEAILAGDGALAAERMRAHVIVQGDRFSDLILSLRRDNAAA
ncbi:GntR family transcriptional regulator [Methylobacterium nodulans]|uniref:Transcriptional regulator, GntR family n=1 Tax=Methylobacterium nodulans (strain LMG 21967 / CNCM I-2342 / ORS 2060) TaxID=460265 RepID=B8ILM0_METNO|nr:GntR family transcriptional regulator [Methylobacterium nodulans]ACL61995.1 transcriptional regulator, GntR family [Methylobacterium nodulans ORS 2060]